MHVCPSLHVANIVTLTYMYIKLYDRYLIGIVLMPQWKYKIIVTLGQIESAKYIHLRIPITANTGTIIEVN